MTKIQNTALLCAALILTGALASCGDTAENKPTADTQEKPQAAVTENEEPVVVSELEKLPEADYNGYTVHIMLYDQDDRQVDIMTAGEENGDIMNDIVFKRNRAVEEKYNVTIVGESDTDGNVNSMIKKEVTSGLNDHDIFYSNCYVAPIASAGYLYEINNLPNVNLSNPWWDTAALKGLSVDNRVYLVTGDISPTSLLTSSCLVFNKVLFANNDMEAPYQLVRDGKWTIDKLAEMTKGLSYDRNGDGKMTMGDDLYSFSSWMCDSPYSLFYGSGGTLSVKDANDIPSVSFDYDKISSIYDKIYEIIIDNDSYFVTDANQYPTTYQNFANGDAYFCEITLQKIDSFLRDMKDDYGILPIPKWDEAQELYMSCVNGAGGYAVVPNNAADPERTGMMMEALGAGAYDIISPALYDVITKTRNVRDEESAEMVEYITRQRVFDPSYINQINGWNFSQSLLSSKKKDVVSTLSKAEKGAIKAMDKLVDAYMTSKE
ncbi:MAG: extracellular solute-binding protein [Clostridia bacterium]|nr:extracellular solute-binding protein [Clostridia bacterium]